jgi:hypothetical protein
MHGLTREGGMPVRTTIVIDEELLRRLRVVAATRGGGLSRAIRDLVRAGLEKEGSARPGYRFDWKTRRGRLMPGVDVNDRDRLYDVMEGRS